MENKPLKEKLFEIHGKIKNPVKDVSGYGYKYANLEQVLEIVKPLFCEYRILLIQRPISEGLQIGMETVFSDMDSNDTHTTKYFIDTPKKDPQGYGSAITYLRRYSLVAMLNLAPEDDDGKAASITKEDSDSLADEIKKTLSLIVDKEFCKKVLVFIKGTSDHKTLTSVLDKVQAQLNKERGI